MRVRVGGLSATSSAKEEALRKEEEMIFIVANW